jgi:cytidine deaminase
MNEVEKERLIEAAVGMMRYSYARYSGFCVGAALLGEDGRIFTGCNVENAAYTPSNCAERTAFFKAVSEGVREFRAIAVVGGKGGNWERFCPPCGVCRQVMMEFCDPERFEVLLAERSGGRKTLLLKELLPEGFGVGQLQT